MTMSRLKSFALLTGLAGLVSGGGALADSLRLSEPVEVAETYEVFGAPMPDKRHGLALSAVIARSAEFEGQTVRITTEVAQVCQKKGCFFIASDGPDWARITFANYGFFLPTDSAGQRATLVGTFSRQPLSYEQAAHYAEDLGEPAPTSADPAFEYAIVAKSVQLHKQ